jgi:hydroxymethylbilane synthase
MGKTTTIRIGTRGSELALAQARAVAEMVGRAHPGRACEIVPIVTKGDRMTKTALWEIGGKGLFVQEIEEALTRGRIDLAVHSMKDLPHDIAPGLALPAVPRREDARDVIVTRSAIGDVGEIPAHSIVGTSSLRRRAQLSRIRPDLSVTGLRGNVGTRLKRLADGRCGALILAAAGLNRLGLGERPHLSLPPDQFVPAAGQGALGVEVRAGEEDLVAGMDDPPTRRAVFCERAFVAALGASCRSAVGAYARVEGERLVLIGRVLSPDGMAMIEGRNQGDAREWEEIGLTLGRDLLERGAGDVLAQAGVPLPE